MAEISAEEMLGKQKYEPSNQLAKMFLDESQSHPIGHDVWLSSL